MKENTRIVEKKKQKKLTVVVRYPWVKSSLYPVMACSSSELCVYVLTACSQKLLTACIHLLYCETGTLLPTCPCGSGLNHLTCGDTKRFPRNYTPRDKNLEGFLLPSASYAQKLCSCRQCNVPVAVAVLGLQLQSHLYAACRHCWAYYTSFSKK